MDIRVGRKFGLGLPFLLNAAGVLPSSFNAELLPKVKRQIIAVAANHGLKKTEHLKLKSNKAMSKHFTDALISEANAAAVAEERYFKLWEREQEHTQTRWKVTTFFVSISFAIFGFSLQTPGSSVPPIVSYSVALAIYWFAYVLFWRFNNFTCILREELQAMETSGQVALKVQTKVNQSMSGQYSKRLSTAYLLCYFGILYAVAIVLLWRGNLN